jgi:hypothetical protein
MVKIFDYVFCGLFWPFLDSLEKKSVAEVYAEEYSTEPGSFPVS